MIRSPIFAFVEPTDDREPRPERPPKRKAWRLSQQSDAFNTIPRDKDGKLIIAMPKPALRLRRNKKGAGDGN